MAINPVASGSASQVIRPQPQADQTRQAEQAKQARRDEQSKQAEEANKPQPVVNTQGQTTGNVINTSV